MRHYYTVLSAFLLLLCIMLPLAACAYELSFSPAGSNVKVIPQSVGKTDYLFLPGSWSDAALVVNTDHEAGVKIAKTLYHDGDAIPYISESRITLQAEGERSKKTVTVMNGSRIPALFISCDEEEYSAILHSKEVKAPGTLQCLSADGRMAYEGSLEYIKTRGNSTFSYSKKAYQIKLSEKKSLLGLGKASKYVLLADYNDISLLRNRITLEMAKAVGLPFAIDCLHVDLYINGRYAGVYLLCEKIEVSSESVAIHDLEKDAELLNPSLKQTELTEGSADGLSLAKWYDVADEPEDITGGYLLETDKTYRVQDASEAGFITDDGMAVYVKSPEHATQNEVIYIGQRVAAFHRAILNKNGIDEQSGLYYTSIIDMDSFATKFIIEEYSKNYDALRGSQYYYKDAGDGLIYACSAWDYDLSYGDIYTEHFKAHSIPNYFYIANYKTASGWWNNLINHEDFMERVKQIYKDRFIPVLNVLLGNAEPDEGSTLRSIQSYEEEIASSAAMNFKRWGRSKYAYDKAGTSFSQGVKYLKNFVEKRMRFLNDNWIEP